MVINTFLNKWFPSLCIVSIPIVIGFLAAGYTENITSSELKPRGELFMRCGGDGEKEHRVKVRSVNIHISRNAATVDFDGSHPLVVGGVCEFRFVYTNGEKESEDD